MAREIPYIGAINEAIHQEMERDESVLLIGQNIATTPDDPFLKAFGSDRVRVTPISETIFRADVIFRDAKGNSALRPPRRRTARPARISYPQRNAAGGPGRRKTGTPAAVRPIPTVS